MVSSKISYSSGDEVLRDVEIAMYRAEQSGRSRCELFDLWELRKDVRQAARWAIGFNLLDRCRIHMD